jgi:cytosine deaminase
VFDMVTTNAARAIGLREYGLIPGQPASLNILHVGSVQEAIRLQAPRRYVLREGRMLAETDRIERAHVEVNASLAPPARA